MVLWGWGTGRICGRRQRRKGSEGVADELREEESRGTFREGLGGRRSQLESWGGGSLGRSRGLRREEFTKEVDGVAAATSVTLRVPAWGPPCIRIYMGMVPNAHFRATHALLDHGYEQDSAFGGTTAVIPQS